MQVSASTFAQSITLKKDNASLKTIFSEIKKQTGYSILYRSDIIDNARLVSVNLKNVPLSESLDKILKDQNLLFTIEDKTVVIRKKEIGFFENIIRHLKAIDVTGRVLDEDGNPIPGVTIAVKQTKQAMTSDASGYFTLKNVDPENKILISFIGYEKKELQAAANLGDIHLKLSIQQLMDVTVNAGYYSVKDQERTGSITKVSADQIARQPVNNVLQALQANVAGVVITQNTGVPGGGFKVQIRGRNSIQQGNNPFYIVDGVPFTSTAVASTRAQFITPDPSPLASINPNDIESIEVLKDADATAIYGSRGANGVVLITTKKGKPGQTKATISFAQGISRVAQRLDLMNTTQYLQMRNEAFANDKVTPAANQYDVNGTWGANSNTDWQKELIGGVAPSTNVQASISGGTKNVQYLIGANYYREGTVFPGNNSYARPSGNFNLQYASEDQKFHAQFAANYSQINSNLFNTDLTSSILLPPNYPALLDQNGALNWGNGTLFLNPLAITKRLFTSKTNNLISNLLMSYEFTKGLNLKVSAGYTTMNRADYNNQPLSTINPSLNPTTASRLAYFGYNTIDTWIAEPQITYDRKIGPGRLNALVGTTFQNSLTNGQTVSGSGYTSDALLQNIASASLLSVTERQYLQYRYTAVFGRLNYIMNDKYILNATARRDGSSRFGSASQFANFGAVGAAWIISQEKFLKENVPFISFAKLRGSYGITGNDQIADYGYLELWNTNTQTYQAISTISPSQISNPNYGWEINKKLEAAIELGFLQDRFNLSAGYYSNRSSSQLVLTSLAPSTGFSSIQDNLPAKVGNTGWEFELSSKNIDTKNFKWSTSVNLTIPKNELLAYPGLATSADAVNYALGQPLSILKTYHTPLDPQTGLLTLEDYNKNGAQDDGDRYITQFKGRKYYGGIENTLSYKGITLDFLIQVVNQTGASFLSSLTNAPGVFNLGTPLINQPVSAFDRWQKPGDVTQFQKFSTTGAANLAYFYAKNQGDLAVSDASFVSLKNISLSYQLPQGFVKRVGLNNAKLYLQGQNVLILTNYKGLSPETQTLANLPALQVFSAGLQITF